MNIRNLINNVPIQKILHKWVNDVKMVKGLNRRLSYYITVLCKVRLVERYKEENE